MITGLFHSAALIKIVSVHMAELLCCWHACLQDRLSSGSGSNVLTPRNSRHLFFSPIDAKYRDSQKQPTSCGRLPAFQFNLTRVQSESRMAQVRLLQAFSSPEPFLFQT